MDVSIACICVGTPHDQDTITLPDRLSFRQLLAIRQDLGLAMQAPGVTQGEIVAALVETYVLQTPVAWTCLDEKGKPLPLSRANVAEYLLGNYAAAEAVGEAADGLYSDTVTLPLQGRAPTSSPATPTPASTSAPTGPGTKRPKPSKRSSTSTTPMAVTGTTGWSQGGVSSSSPS